MEPALAQSEKPKRTAAITLTGWLISSCLAVYIVYSTIAFSSIRSQLAVAATLKPQIIRLSPSVEQSGTPEAEELLVISPPPSSNRSIFNPWHTYESLFFFGDSYTQTLFDPNGAQPSAADPFGNHEEVTRNWAYYLTAQHNESLLFAYNFAVGGSVVDLTISKPFLLGLDFRIESDTFLQHYGPGSSNPKAPWDPATSLFFAWFGVNDLFLPRARGEDHGPDLPSTFASYRKSMEKLYIAGARDFIILTVPPAYRSVPYEIEALFEVAEDVASFNARVFEMRTSLAMEYTDARFAVFDAHSFWTRVIEVPKDFDETKDVPDGAAICDDAEDMVDGIVMCKDGGIMREHLWEQLHGTFVIHNATAAEIVKDCFGPEGKTGYCF